MSISSHIKACLALVAFAALVILLSQLGDRPESALASAANGSNGPATATPTPTATAVILPYCWSKVDPPDTGGQGTLGDVDALAADDVWVVGYNFDSGVNSVALHWDGTTWTDRSSSVTQHSRLFEIDIISHDDVWAAGRGNYEFHWDGTQWTALTGPGGDHHDFVAVADNDLWIAGDYPCGQKHPCAVVWHWDGSSWTQSYNRTCDGTCISTLRLVGPNDLRVSAYLSDRPDDPGWMARWDGTQWTDITDDGIRGAGSIYDIASTSANDIWLSAHSGIIHWNGTTWTTYTEIEYRSLDLVAISPWDVWAVGGGKYYHWDGAHWERVEGPVGSNGANPRSIAAVNANDVWAVGSSNQPQIDEGKLITHYSSDCASACGLGWREVPRFGTGSLTGVAMLSANDVWAVGTDSAHNTLIEHWDGQAWSLVGSPNPGTASNSLAAISAVSSNDIWAVGSYSDVGGRPMALTMHWNGSYWSVVPSPSPGGVYNYLYGVAAISHNDVWAVGIFSGPYQMLLEHWDGSAWTLYSVPGIVNSELTDIKAISSTDIWAVGNYLNPSTNSDDTLTIHWNGSNWTKVPSPSPEWANYLNQVDSVASNDVWAVGYVRRWVGGTFPLILHWDGSAWTEIEGYDVGNGQLLDVEVHSPIDVWVTGFDYPSYDNAFIEHWDGTRWSLQPDPLVEELIYDLEAAASDDVWAVGTYNTVALIEHYSSIYCPPPPEPPRCPGERFTDVCPTDYFYQHVLDLNDLGIISGYNTTPPCDGPAHIPCFKPYNWTTRGQIAKIISLAAGFNEPVSGQMFADVEPGHTFYQYIERIGRRGIVNGYPCGGEGEPCIPPEWPSYFRPANSVSRGQLTKMAALAFGLDDPVDTQTFEDVPPGHTFYQYTERLAVLGIVSGYDCGNPEPCVPPDHRPYYRPANHISRGQIAKIVNLARVEPTATPTNTPTRTNTPLYSATPSVGSPTRTSTSTPPTTATSTPSIPTPSTTPTCCTGITGSISGSCQPAPYTVDITINNSCSVTVTANIASSFQVSPNSNGPWQTLYIGDCFGCPIPPGKSHQSTTVYSGPLPPGNNWWRYTKGYYGATCFWSLLLETDPQPACVAGTITPSPTVIPTTSTPTP